MALNLATFKANLKTALLRAPAKNQNDNVNIDTALGNLADEIAAAVDKYIKTATVSTTVTGTCATQSGAWTIAGTGTGSGTGSLS